MSRSIHTLGFACILASCAAAPACVRADAAADRTQQQKVNPQVASVIKEASAAYQRMKSYRHIDLFNLHDTGSGRDYRRRYVLAWARPNRFCYKRLERLSGASVSDGGVFCQYREAENEYIKSPAPVDGKRVEIDWTRGQDVASYLIVKMTQGAALTDPDCITRYLGMLAPSRPVVAAGTAYRTFSGVRDATTVTLCFSPTTHLLTMCRFATSNGNITETLSDIAVDKPIPAVQFHFAPPAGSRPVTAFQHLRGATAADEAAIRARFVGRPAPDFTASDSDGNGVSLSAFKGKVVIVTFWETYSDPSLWLMSMFQDLQQRYGKRRLAVLPVDTGEARERFDTFLTANPRYSGCLCDPSEADFDGSIAAKLYGVTGLPTVVIVDQKGIVRSYAAGARARSFYVGALQQLGLPTAGR